MNAIETHLIIRNNNHCPNCRKWYITPKKDMSKLQNNDIKWEGEWTRKRNGDKYQNINIKLNKEYDLSDWGLEINKNINIEATHLILKIMIDQGELCPNNIKFYLNFFDNYQSAYDYTKEYVKYREMWSLDNEYCGRRRNNDGKYDEKKKVIDDMELPDLKDGYWSDQIYTHNDGNVFIILIELEENEEICLNDYCSKLTSENW